MKLVFIYLLASWFPHMGSVWSLMSLAASDVVDYLVTAWLIKLIFIFDFRGHPGNISVDIFYSYFISLFNSKISSCRKIELQSFGVPSYSWLECSNIYLMSYILIRSGVSFLTLSTYPIADNVYACICRLL